MNNWVPRFISPQSKFLLLFFLCLCNSPKAEERNFEWQLQGQTRFSYWFWDIYDIGYWKNSQSTHENTGVPSRLISIRYLRDIKSGALISETRKQWVRANIKEKPAEKWLRELSVIWPDVKNGDRIDFTEQDGKVCFFLNKQSIGQIYDHTFAVSFFDIWVGEKSEYPKQSLALRNNRQKAPLIADYEFNCPDLK